MFTLSDETLYIDKDSGWQGPLAGEPGQYLESLPFRLSGWQPHYFTITRPGSDSGELRQVQLVSE